MNAKTSRTILRLMIGLFLLALIAWAVPSVAEAVEYQERYVVEYVGEGNIVGPRVRRCASVASRPFKNIKVGTRVAHLPQRQATMSAEEGTLYYYENVWYKPVMECGEIVWIATIREYDDD